MEVGLDKTIAILSKSRNDAATAALLAALEAGEREVFSAVVRGLLQRRAKHGHAAVLQLWPTMDESQRALLEHGRGRISGALRDAILASDDALFASSCEIIDRFNEYDLIATLVNIAETPNSPRADAATTLTLKLTNRLNQAMRQPREPGDRRDPTAMRRHILESLQRSVERFRSHKRSELVEAYMVLAGAQSATLRSLLDSPHHPCFQVVLQALTLGDSDSIVGLLMDFLRFQNCPHVVRNVTSRRTDAKFIGALLELSLTGSNTAAAQNVSRIASFAFLSPPANLTQQLDERQQAAALRLAAASGLAADLRLD